MEETGPLKSRRPLLELMDASFNTPRKRRRRSCWPVRKTCSSGFFEQVVVRPARAMSYGESHRRCLKVTGKSGDGGIDGIIKEDKLGLGVVCIQAKRWDCSVGRPVIQGFVGSMDYIRAKKGVILTTSQFTRDALDYADRIEGKKVVLIDGAKLTNLMIEHNVMVTRPKLYELKEVSNDFDDDEGFLRLG